MSAREPVAEIGAEDYRAGAEHVHTDECLDAVDPGQPEQVWMRIVPCLPNSLGAGEGWAFEYREAKPHARGAFRAVVFR